MRFKGTCDSCHKTVVCDVDEEDSAALEDTKKGELFQHRCPVCNQNSTFEIIKVYN